MKKKIVFIGSLLLTLICTSAFIIKQSTGMVGKTGAPGEGDCTSCHGGGSGVTTVNITASPAFVADHYSPGQTYTVSIEVKSTTLTRFGFDCEILNSASFSAVNAGTITGISGSSQLLLSGTRKNATHTTPGTGSGSPSSKTFTFKWVAPTSGTAIVYAAGLAVNLDGNNTGDLVNTSSLVLTSDVPTAIQSIQNNTASFSVFPNPSTNDVNLKYNTAQDGLVKATLYSLQGKEISVLFSEDQKSGIHQQSLSLDESISAGVYIVKLSLNSVNIGEERIVKN